MGEKAHVIGPLELKYTGVFDFVGILDLIYKWFERHQYIYQEKKYKDKKESWRGNEKEIDWTGYRKVTEYVKFDVEVHMHVFEGKDIQAEKNGKKQTLHEGRFEMNFKGEITLDWQGRFGEGKIAEQIGKFYNTLKKREHEEIHEAALESEIEELQGKIKKIINMSG